MSEQTSTDMRPATIAKSDQINADDLIGGPITVTVQRAVRYDRKDQPVEVHTVETPGRCFRPCKTMTRLLVAVWGHDGATWTGRTMTLYRDPRAHFGEFEGGVRISHVSGIHGPVSISLAVSKGKKAMYRVEPMDDAPQTLAAVLDRHGLTVEQLDAWLAKKQKPASASLDKTETARLVAWLNRSAPIAEIRG